MEVPNTKPSPPMKLMIPLACERNLEGVTSGISATTGVRQNAIARIVVTVQAMNRGRVAASGTRPKAIAAIGAPIRIKGRRLPSLVRRRSDQAPTGGWMKRAAMLSSDIKKPIWAESSRNFFSSRMGTYVL